MNKTFKILGLFIIILSLSGCSNNEEKIIIDSNVELDDNIDYINESNTIINSYKYTNPEDKIVENIINNNISLDENEEIEDYEWIKDDIVLRVKVKYIEEPENEYIHKEDYFLFFKDDELIQNLNVNYPSKEADISNVDRYVWDACDFDAHFEDVNFDGQEDLIIFLGHSGVHGTEIYCAYLYTEEGYCYNSTFEDIPNYKVDEENQVIRGYNVDNAVERTEFIYVYEDNKFVEKKHISGDINVIEQIEIFSKNIPYLNEGYKYSPCITVYDLNKDGKLELITSCIQGSGYYSYNFFYNVNDTYDGIIELEEKICYRGEVSGFDLEYIKPYEAYEKDGVIYYKAIDYIRSCGKEEYIINGAFYLEDNIIYDIAYTREDIIYSDELGEKESFYYEMNNRELISEEEYINLNQQFWQDMNPIECKLNWIYINNAELETLDEYEIFEMLVECYNNSI